MKYFAYDYGLTMTNDRFAKLFGHPVRPLDGAPMEQFHWDMAASIQKVTEEIVLGDGARPAPRSGMKNLCMAGGVALNCVANGRIVREGPFENSGCSPRRATPAARSARRCSPTTRCSASRAPSRWITATGARSIRTRRSASTSTRAVLPTSRSPRDAMIRETARLLAEEQAVVGWFQGGWSGDRARSAAAASSPDARNRENWQRVNLKIKYRESFRPFAPACLRGEALGLLRARPREPVHAAGPAR
jgi:carbamoyltransferase